MKLIICFVLLLTPVLGIAQQAILYKDQTNSSFDWKKLQALKFLDFKDWKLEEDKKAITPDWETILRDRNNKEMGGRVLQCVGSCKIDRGDSYFVPEFRSSFIEGDEIQTLDNSYAWVFFLDGTMMRLSPNSSVTLNEFNIGVEENFINVRVNAGDVLWVSRTESGYLEQNFKDTDLMFHPMEFYEAQEFQDNKIYDESDLIELVEEKETYINQILRLNKLVEKNNKITKGKKTYAFISSPAMTLMGYNPQVEIVALIGGKNFVKKKTVKQLNLTEYKEELLEYQLRGYENKTIGKVEEDIWYEVDEKGKSIKILDEANHFLTGEFLTSRIHNIMVARELLIEKYSEFLFQTNFDRKKLALENGYRLWGKINSEDPKENDLKRRVDFLKEYSRRIETSNLLTAERFKDKLFSRGEKLQAMEYGTYFYIKALEKYLKFTEYKELTSEGLLLNSTTKTLWKKMHGIK